VDRDATAAWLGEFVVAAGAAGFPVCATLALVDQATGNVKDQQMFGTGEPVM